MGQQNIISNDDWSVVAVVNLGDRDLFGLDVLPDVKLHPVADRKNSEMFPDILPAIIEAPKFGPLVLRIPLTMGVAMGEKSLFCPCFLFVTTGTAKAGIKF